MRRKNICRVLIFSPCMDRVRAGKDGVVFERPPVETIEFVIKDGVALEVQGLPVRRGAEKIYTAFVEQHGIYEITVTTSSNVKKEKLSVTAAMRNSCVFHSAAVFIFSEIDKLPKEKSGTVLVGPGKNYLYISLRQDRAGDGIDQISIFKACV